MVTTGIEPVRLGLQPSALPTELCDLNYNAENWNRTSNRSLTRRVLCLLSYFSLF